MSVLGDWRGMPIYESTMALRYEQARKHNPRKGGSAYHRRINKKWLKRFGTTAHPSAYLVNGALLGMQGQCLYAHPSIVAQLRSQP